MIIIGVIFIYAFFTLVTFGHLYRSHLGRVGPKLFALSFAWPAYWIVSHGVGATLRVFLTGLGLDDDASWRICVVIGLFTAGWFAAKNWASCTDTYSCAMLSVKAAALVPAFPFYWGWILAS